MDKILHENLGEEKVFTIKKATEPCKYEVFDPNVSDEDNLEDNNKIHKSIFDKM